MKIDVLNEFAVNSEKAFLKEEEQSKVIGGVSSPIIGSQDPYIEGDDPIIFTPELPILILCGLADWGGCPSNLRCKL